MSEALYRKYRPNVFSDVVGQQHILKTLQNAITNNRLSHAYLFCGPRGTGKTTMARILAKACLCTDGKDSKSPTSQPCGKCQDCSEVALGQHPDVYELDAASRTGVENVREEIIGRVQFASTRGKKKIYIIDEVHMLSIAAFNALLKTLEEPPNHVIFVLCTTDPQKVPETILSRCQRFDFKPISTDEIVSQLQYVCDCEGAQAQSDALKLVANNAQGGMRNALTQLEQLIAFSEGEISLDTVKQGSSLGTDIDFVSLFEKVGKRDLPAVFDWVEKFCQSGADFNQATNQMMQTVRDMYVSSAGGYNNPGVDTSVLNLYTSDRLHRMLLILADLVQDLKISVNPRLSFEVSLAKMARPEVDLTLESLAERVAQLEKNINEGINMDSASIPAENTKNKKNVNNNEDYNDYQINDASFELIDELSSAKPTQKTQEQKLSFKPKWADIKPIPESMEKKHQKDFSEFKNSEALRNNNTQKYKNYLSNQKEQANQDFYEKNNTNINDYNNMSSTPDLIINKSTKPSSDLRREEDSKATSFNEKKENNLQNMKNVENKHNDKIVQSQSKLEDSETLHKLWHQAFTNIKRKHPAYAAFLMTANPKYELQTHTIVLEFPASTAFAIQTLQKPETMKKIVQEVEEVVGSGINLKFAQKDIENKSNFHPTFTDMFREQNTTENKDKQEDKIEKTKDVNNTNINSVRNILESMGANIIEE